MNEIKDKLYMQKAYQEAIIGLEDGEIPVGAIIVCQDRVIAKGHNLTERLNDITAHAEMQAITSAAEYLGGKYLKDCTLYVTLEPCIMCAGALAWSQISRIVYAASDEHRGFSRITEQILHPKTIVDKGIMEEECTNLMKDFFKKKR
ncbi:MAG: nucleoside deaminase [Marinifilaceae bacterium]|jgi:tRNA(adenine34) deaminase